METCFGGPSPTNRRKSNGYEMRNAPETGHSSRQQHSNGPFAAYHNTALNGDDSQMLRLHHRAR